MVSPTLLLYNLSGDQLTAIKRLCLKLRIRPQVVQPEAFGQSIGAVVGLCPADETAEPERFDAKMLVMAGFTNALLDRFLAGYRREQIEPVPLKAVLTPSNQSWSGAALCRALQQEHMAIQQQINGGKTDV